MKSKQFHTIWEYSGSIIRNQSDSHKTISLYWVSLNLVTVVLISCVNHWTNEFK